MMIIFYFPHTSLEGEEEPLTIARHETLLPPMSACLFSAKDHPCVLLWQGWSEAACLAGVHRQTLVGFLTTPCLVEMLAFREMVVVD